MTSRSLLYAILAMDSYNREYGEGLSGLGSAVGEAVFRNHKSSNVTEDEFSKWQAASFYAASYRLGDGTTVISYRGTDDPSLAGDIWNGWLAATGFPIFSQPRMAMDFYKDVTGKEYIRQGSSMSSDWTHYLTQDCLDEYVA